MAEPLTHSYTMRNAEELSCPSAPYFAAWRREAQKGEMLYLRPSFKPVTKEGPEPVLLTACSCAFGTEVFDHVHVSLSRTFWAPPASGLRRGLGPYHMPGIPGLSLPMPPALSPDPNHLSIPSSAEGSVLDQEKNLAGVSEGPHLLHFCPRQHSA